MSILWQEGVATKTTDPSQYVSEGNPPPGRVLPVKAGDIIAVSKRRPGWVYGTVGWQSGWLPASCMQFRSLNPHEHLAADLSSLSVDTRKDSQVSASTLSSDLEPLDGSVDTTSDISDYTVVSAPQKPAVWVPYYHDGSVVYLDTKHSIVSQSVPFTDVDQESPEKEIRVPHWLRGLNISNHKHVLSFRNAPKSQPCLYKNSDLYKSLRTVGRVSRMPGVWADAASKAPEFGYTTWQQAMQGFFDAVDVLKSPDLADEQVGEALVNLTGHVHSICRATHVPAGTNPAQSLVGFSLAHRLVVSGIVEMRMAWELSKTRIPPDYIIKWTLEYVSLYHHQKESVQEEINPMPPTVVVSVLEGDWNDHVFETTVPLTKITTPQDDRLKQSIALESANLFANFSETLRADITSKTHILQVNVDEYLKLWASLNSKSQNMDDSWNDYGIMLFTSLHSVLTVGKSLIAILDGYNLQQGFVEKGNEVINLLMKRRAFIEALFHVEKTWGELVSYGHLLERSESHVEYLPILVRDAKLLFEAVFLSYDSHTALEDLNDDKFSDSIIYDARMQARGGSKRSLVEYVTMHGHPRPQEVCTVLTTFPAFMTHIELIDLLRDRFALQPPTGLSRAELQEWQELVQGPTRLRVVNMIRLWLESYWTVPEDEDTRIIFLQRFEVLLRVLSVQDVPGYRKLRELFRHRQEGSSDYIPRKSSANGTLPEPILPREMGVGEQLTVLDIDPREMARQLTLLESSYYMRVTKQSCLKRAVDQSPAHTEITEFVSHWNLETYWVSHEILSAEKSEDRARRIEYFTRVAVECRRLNNFSSMMAILSALNSAGIYRLKQSWAQVSGRSLADIEVIHRLMNSNRNFNEYRDILSLISEPAVPFFGVYLMDLRFASDGNSDFLNGDCNVVNFAKWCLVASIIDSTLRFQLMEYQLQPVEVINSYLQDALQKSPNLNEQYETSLLREPRASVSSTTK